MPELPEVENVVRMLSTYVSSKTIKNISLNRTSIRFPIPENIIELTREAKIVKVERRAKYILFYLDNDQVIVSHLGMSGQMILQSLANLQNDKHLCYIINFTDGDRLFYTDIRKFGMIDILPRFDLDNYRLLKSLGFEPVDKSLCGSVLYKMLSSSKTNIKSFLLNQKNIVGVGNIYASEILFLSKIIPTRFSNLISKREADLLLDNIRLVLEDATEKGGSTWKDYVKIDGSSGNAQNFRYVYGKKNEPCPSCGSKIIKIMQSNRGTYYCSKCQL